MAATDYVTDAERYGWSIVQRTVLAYDVVNGADWRHPDGEHEALTHLPVTQVSYHGAQAYCKWAGTRLPTYEEYWRWTKKDARPVIEKDVQMYPVAAVNLGGNVWEITTTENVWGEIRLAGGSFLCNDRTCDGTSVDRVLQVDKITGNYHISFVVLD
ncbi:MAG: SUMF1/EgtB/PvdO family nonheme iron enzyme [Bacteroidota bacterium]